MSDKPFNIPKDPEDCDHTDLLESTAGTSAICKGCGIIILLYKDYKPKATIDIFDIVLKRFETVKIPREVLLGTEVADCHVPIVDNEDDYK